MFNNDDIETLKRCWSSEDECGMGHHPGGCHALGSTLVQLIYRFFCLFSSVRNI